MIIPANISVLFENAVRAEYNWLRARREKLVKYPDGEPHAEAEVVFAEVLRLKKTAFDMQLRLMRHYTEKAEGIAAIKAVRDTAMARLMGDGMTFTIDDDKLDAVTLLFNQTVDPKATRDIIRAEICADWNEPESHQNWIDQSEPETIVDWLTAFYTMEPDAPDEEDEGSE